MPTSRRLLSIFAALAVRVACIGLGPTCGWALGPDTFLTGLGGTNGFDFTPAGSPEEAGQPVLGLGDFNGDGRDDFLVGARVAASSNGVAYVIFGRGDRPVSLSSTAIVNGSSGFLLQQTDVDGGAFPQSAAAGDFNGDGLADIALGAFNVPTGVVFVVWGTTNPLGTTLVLTASGGPNHAAFSSPPPSDHRGAAVAAVDFNGDTFDDLVVGEPIAPTATAGGAPAGRIRIVFGAPTWPPSLNVTTLNGTNGFTVDGVTLGGAFGASLAGLGDFNGDGFDDLAVGNPDPNIGSVTVMFGLSNAFVPVVAATNTASFKLVAAESFSLFGTSVAAAGDVNGDSYFDLLVGEPNTDAAHLVFGGPDPFPPTAQVDGAPHGGVRFFGAGPAANRLGQGVAGIGDPTRDGFNDFALGAPALNGNQGAVYFLSGGSNWPANVALTNAPGIQGVRYLGSVPNGLAGFSVSAAGDFDGDGGHDMLVGSPQINGPGQAHLVYGASPPLGPGPGTFRFTQALASGVESNAAIVLSVTRGGDVSAPASVGYRTVPGSAQAGLDFVAANARLGWTNGQSGTVALSIALIDNAATNGPRQFDVELFDPQPTNMSLVAPSVVRVSILDDEGSGPVASNVVAVAFTRPVFSQLESLNAVDVSIERLGAPIGTLTADLRVVPQSTFDATTIPAVTSSFTWADGESGPKTLSVPLLDDTLSNGVRRATLLAFSPNKSNLADRALLRVVDDDLPLDAVVDPDPDLPRAQLSVTLGPAEAVDAGAQWRLLGDRLWRASGSVAFGLDATNHVIVFKPVSGFGPPEPVTVLLETGTNSFSAVYSPTNLADGTLTVVLQPGAAVAAGAGWRLAGDDTFQPSGASISRAPGAYLLEYGSASGFVTPPVRDVQLNAARDTLIVEPYFPEAAATGAAPLPVDTNLLGQPPFVFNGQVVSDIAEGSGVAVRERVVLTSTRVVFSDHYLGYARNVQWLHQRIAGSREPAAATMTGALVFGGYSRERRTDARRLDPTGRATSVASRNASVAVLVFDRPIARNGQGGLLVSDTTPNQWLESAAPKFVAGYPSRSEQFGQPGRLHATAPSDLRFALDRGASLDEVGNLNRVYISSDFFSAGGAGGGPVYVEVHGRFLPAAVFLATDETGRSYVRALDADVAAMIRTAERLSFEDPSFSRLARAPLHARLSGGVVGVSSGTGMGQGGFFTGAVLGHLNPSQAAAAGARWRLTPSSAWRADGESEKSVAVGSFSVSFRAASGFATPANRSVPVEANQTTPFSVTYNPGSGGGGGSGQLNGVELSNAKDNKTFRASVAADFNDDQVADLVQASQGVVRIQKMATNQLGFEGLPDSVLGPLSPGRWRVVGAGDINLDRATDLIRQKGNAFEMVFLNGEFEVQSTVPLTIPDSAKKWKGIAAADFNHDLVPDLVQIRGKRTRIAFLSSSGNTTVSNVVDTLPKGKLSAVGDVSGSAQPDFIIKRGKTLSAAILDDASRLTSSGTLNDANANRTLKVVAAGDVDGDGLDDLIRTRGKLVNVLLSNVIETTIAP